MSEETENIVIIPEKEKRKSRTSKTSPEKIAYRENVLKTLELRKNGFTYDEILEQMPGVWNSVQAAAKAVSAVLDKAELDAALEFKRLSIIRLEKCVAPVLKKAENGNLLAVDRIIRISKREGEILGFDEGSDNDLNLGFEIVIKDETERPKS